MTTRTPATSRSKTQFKTRSKARLEARIDAELDDLIVAAADRLHVTRTTFVTEAVLADFYTRNGFRSTGGQGDLTLYMKISTARAALEP